MTIYAHTNTHTYIYIYIPKFERNYLCQRKYAFYILTNSGLLGIKPVNFPPVEEHNSFGKAKGPLLSSPYSYHRLNGHLTYLTITRLDLAYSVHILVMFIQKPRQAHWDAVIRIFQYLKGSL